MDAGAVTTAVVTRLLSHLLLSNIFDSEKSCLVKMRERALELSLELDALISDKDQDERENSCSYGRFFLWQHMHMNCDSFPTLG